MILVTLSNEQRKRLPSLLENESETLGIYWEDDAAVGEEKYPRETLLREQERLADMASKVERQSVLYLDYPQFGLLKEAVEAEVGSAEAPEPALLLLLANLEAEHCDA